MVNGRQVNITHHHSPSTTMDDLLGTPPDFSLFDVNDDDFSSSGNELISQIPELEQQERMEIVEVEDENENEKSRNEEEGKETKRFKNVDARMRDDLLSEADSTNTKKATKDM